MLLKLEIEGDKSEIDTEIEAKIKNTGFTLSRIKVRAL